MCAIAGIVKFDRHERAERSRLEAMGSVQRHRGPDGFGLWLQGPAGLAHRRLAIVDLAGGHQPMANEDESLWIVFNGEIYNHRELRPELERAGHRYRTNSDTETILHLYEEHGTDCLHRLQGMFAFALWDAARSRLLLARDRLGIKPLYYARTGRELLFASEIKGILASGAVKASFNAAVLPEFLASRYVSGPETFYRGVHKLLPGHLLEWSPEDGFLVRRYWHPPLETSDDGASLSEQAGRLLAGLKDAVSSHLMSDVPLGLFLSGGLDSSGLAALMAPMMREPVKTFAVGFAERQANELHYARIAARAAGAEHHEVLLSPHDFMRALPRLVWHEDEPIAFASSVPLYFVSRLASEHVKVVLTGEGADELFLGYDYRYRVTALNDRIGRLYWKAVPSSMRRRIAGSLSRLPLALQRVASRSALAYEPGPRGLFFENFSVFPETLQRSLLLDPAALGGDPHAEGLAYWEEHRGTLLERMSYADVGTHLVELLMKQDQMSMAASLESRVPYLDHRLVEQAMTIPGDQRMRRWQTKVILREALRDLVPTEILTRPKMGFPVPFGGWIRGPFRRVLDEYVTAPRALDRHLFRPEFLHRLVEEHSRGLRSHADRLWLLVNLELWHRIAIDGEDAEALQDPIENGALEQPTPAEAA
ncbi:MAG TPA: asparagine synthase (glutamine-hydrolyzing) [Nitrospira sp.]|nr:asparagine synthase (glutamine-hydrolyzing) [Nitrospira sp.]